MNTKHTHWRAAHRPLAAFTAIEVVAVATIIAILVLVLVPIMRGRVEEAKRVAAMDDLMSIEKAQTLANADTGMYFRLQDLTRPAADPELLATVPTEILKVPQATWNQQALPNQIAQLTRTWKGPQLGVHNSITVNELVAVNRILVTLDGAQGEGPILVLQDDQTDWVGTGGGWTRAKYPIDPWGNPYIFLGPGLVTAPQGIRGLRPGFTNETNFQTAFVYSLGPDGQPGNAPANDPLNFYRNVNSSIGGGGTDDVVREF
jgi:Tfp pilus assembly protein PilE